MGHKIIVDWYGTIDVTDKELVDVARTPYIITNVQGTGMSIKRTYYIKTVGAD